jgi:hypothetical protein
MSYADTYDKKIGIWLYPLLLFICGIAFFSRLPLHMDILFSDEGNYLLIARNMFEKTDMSFGPLYSVWLKLLGLFFQDIIPLYYFNYAFLSVIVPLLMYTLLTRLSFNRHTSFFVALSFLYSATNVTLWPKVSHFGLLLLLPGLLLAMRAHLRSVCFLVLALTTLILSYARQEYLGLSMILLLVSFYFIRKERKEINMVSTAAMIVCFAVIILVFKAPENNYDETGNYTRSFTAFIQHYYLGLEFQGKHFDYWWLSTKDLYYHGEFENSRGSIFHFIRLYPEEFCQHILFDIKMYILQVTGKFVLITNPLLTKFSNRNLLISLILLVASLVIFFMHPPTKTHIKAIVQKNKFFILILFILILPPLAASLIILPRDHYIFLQIIFYITLAGIYAEIIFTRFPRLKFGLIPLALVCLFFQSPAKFPFIKAGPKADPHTNVELIHFLRDSLPNKNYQLFSDNIFITGLLPARFTEPTLMEYSFDFKNFHQFLEEKKINLILTTSKTNTEPYLRRDPVWNKFLADPASIGFRSIPMGSIDSTFRLYIK